MPISLRQTMTAPPAVGPWPGTTTQTNLDWEKQQQDQMSQALQGLGTLVSQAEAAQFARQQESEQARQAYMAAVEGPSPMAPSLAMALPYAAAQFSSAISGQPQVGAQADQSLALNRSLQIQKRSQVLEQLAAQTQEAARRAEAAGDLTNSLKFNTKANLYLKQIEEAGTGLREARHVAQQQTFDAWQTMYTARAHYLSSLVASGSSQNPVLAARLTALKERHDAEVRPIQDQLTALGVKPAEKAALQARLEDVTNRYTSAVELALSGAPIAPIAGPAAAPPPTAPPKAIRSSNLPVILGGPSVPEANQRVVAAADSIRSVYAGIPLKEVIASWQEKDPASGRRKGDIVAQRFGVDFASLMKAARKLAPGHGGGGRF